MSDPLITSPAGVLAMLTGVVSLFFFLEKKARWKFFDLFPSLLFIYAVPMVLSNTSVILRTPRDVLPSESPLFDWMGSTVLPMFLVLMLLKVDVATAVKSMGKGVLVMLCGTAGVILGAPVAYFLVKQGLGPESWKAFGVLAGSWIGGTGNMAATNEALEASTNDFGLAVLGDAMVYLIWLPILLGSKRCAGWFNRFARVDPKRIERLEASSADLSTDEGAPAMQDFVYLLFLGFLFPWLASMIASRLPEFPPVLSTSTWKILLITTFAIALSMTPARRIRGSQQLAVALVYIFVAQMGAKANIAGLASQAGWFLLGAYIWIFLHGACCVMGARLLHVDVHSTAIASAANIGGIASAPVVASCHNQKLVPASILMALIGYALGNYGAILAAWLCHLVS